jgi:hypothetical protein
MSILSLNSLLRNTNDSNADTGSDNANNPTTSHDAGPNFSTPSLSSAAMLVELSISVWTGRKKDKRATADVTATNHAKSGVAAVNKKLMAECAELDAIQKFAANVRTFHYSATLPWTDTGIRCTTTAKYFAYHQQITQLQNEFERLVNDFLSAYQWEVDKAQASLGAMFHRDDYPSIDSLRNKFAFRVSYIPMPEAGDWRVDIGTEAQRQLKEQYEQYIGDRLKQATADVYRRCSEAITRLVNSMDWTEGEKPKRMYESTFDSVCELVDIMQDFNLTGDTTMEALRKQLATVMDGVSLDAIKSDHALRAEKKQQLEQAIKALPSLDW